MIIAVLLIVSQVFLIVGCANTEKVLLECNDKNFAKYTGKAVNGMSAFDLIMEAYENVCEDRDHTREEYFYFKSIPATRNTHLISKIVDDKVYNQEIIYGTGFDHGTCATRFYYDGENASYINNTNKRDISYKKSTKEFKVKKWGEFAPFTGDVEAKLRDYRNKITTYDIYSRDILSPTHSDKVYENDGVYYCQIKIDCSTEKMDTVQLAALNEFLELLSANREGFTVQDTTIDFAISKIDGKYKFLIWKRTEIFSGKHSTGISVSCRQEILSYYYYGNTVITSDDLLNLA